VALLHVKDAEYLADMEAWCVSLLADPEVRIRLALGQVLSVAAQVAGAQVWERCREVIINSIKVNFVRSLPPSTYQCYVVLQARTNMCRLLHIGRIRMDIDKWYGVWHYYTTARCLKKIRNIGVLLQIQQRSSCSTNVWLGCRQKQCI
jgi:hypothetical protein